jgi:hypothetical protein
MVSTLFLGWGLATNPPNRCWWTLRGERLRLVSGKQRSWFDSSLWHHSFSFCLLDRGQCQVRCPPSCGLSMVQEWGFSMGNFRRSSSLHQVYYPVWGGGDTDCSSLLYVYIRSLPADAPLSKQSIPQHVTSNLPLASTLRYPQTGSYWHLHLTNVRWHSAQSNATTNKLDLENSICTGRRIWSMVKVQDAYSVHGEKLYTAVFSAFLTGHW